MTKYELISKYLAEKAECNRKHAESRRLKHATSDPKLKKDYEADQDYYSSRKYAIEGFLKDLEQLDLQKSLYSMGGRDH